MEVIPGLEAWPADIDSTVVTIGMFDGVHRGHRKIIEQAHQRARELDLRCAIFTFDRHPLEVIKPGKHPPILSSSAQKLRLLEELDVDLVLIAHFDAAFARIPADQFFEEILVKKLRSKVIVVGANFHFGFKGEGDVRYLTRRGEEKGIEVISVPLLKDGSEVISSTNVRRLLEKGEVEEANRRLGWDYLLEGFVARGDSRGAALGFPTANLEIHDLRCIPANGVYGGKAFVGHHRYPAAIYIGTVPTFRGRKRRVEVHIMGLKEELYSRYIGISFLFRLRPEMTFKDQVDLKRQIQEDVRRIRERIKEGYGGRGHRKSQPEY
jgi:riboflavin kinase/FMN adenylyltransferase